MKRILWAFLALCAVLAMWGWCFHYAHNFLPKTDCKIQDLGVFGDSFGSINALFSGLAFAGVVIALVFQAHDAKQQREEFRLQARISACAAIIDAEKILLDLYERAIDRKAPPPIHEQPSISWADMVERSVTRILEMSVALEEERKLLITNVPKKPGATK